MWQERTAGLPRGLKFDLEVCARNLNPADLDKLEVILDRMDWTIDRVVIDVTEEESPAVELAFWKRIAKSLTFK